MPLCTPFLDFLPPPPFSKLFQELTKLDVWFMTNIERGEGDQELSPSEFDTWNSRFHTKVDKTYDCLVYFAEDCLWKSKIGNKTQTNWAIITKFGRRYNCQRAHIWHCFQREKINCDVTISSGRNTQIWVCLKMIAL